MNSNYFTYLNYYGNSSFSMIKFNEIDMLIFSSLVYLPVVNHKEGITFKQYGEKMNSLSKKDYLGTMTPEALDLMKAAYNCKRYRDIKIYKYEKTDNDKLQFGAFTLRFNGITCVVYEGTNTSIAGWIENFALMGEFPSLTQTYGINYLKRTIKSTDKKIYLGGHSKGGNLALSSAYLAPDVIFDRIRKIYNFDGPGFRLEEFKNPRFTQVNKKTLNYLPDGSVVGIFMCNKNYKYVDTIGVGFQRHDPLRWQIFGSFLKKGEILVTSATLQEKSKLGTLTQDPEALKKALVVADKFFEDNNIRHTYDIQKLKLKDYNKLLKNYKSMDPESKAIFEEVVKYIFNANKHTK